MIMENLKVIVGHESDSSVVIRYCQIDKYGSLTGCRENILDVFPELNETIWKMYWIDEDDDHIEITDETSYSCFKMATDDIKRKIYIDDGKIIVNFPEAASVSKGKPHPSIFCNNCNADIYGFRYKCVECPDFDLCKNCEGEILHKEHVMFRIPIPLKKIPFHKNIIKEFNMMNDLSTDTDVHSKRYRRRRIGNKQTFFVPSQSLSTPANDNNFSELEKLNNYSQILNDFIQMFNNFSQSFDKLRDKMDIATKDIISNTTSPYKSDKIDLPKIATRRKMNEKSSLKTVSQDYPVLSESSSNFCQVDTKEIKDCRKSNEKCSLQLLFKIPEQVSALKNIVPAFQQDPKGKNENAIPESETVNFIVSKDSLKSVQSAEVNAPGETKEPFALPFSNVEPHIANALTVMKNLGYRNEGWLISLLESVDGNILKALDLLQHGK